jgi:hypothetical protein
MKLCEEALKYSQGENEYTAVIFNEGKSFLWSTTKHLSSLINLRTFRSNEMNVL